MWKRQVEKEGGGREKRERELAKMCCEKEKEWVCGGACV